MNKKIFIFAGTTEGRELFVYALDIGLNVSAFVATKDGKKAIEEDEAFLELASHKCRDKAGYIPIEYQEKIRVGRLDLKQMVEVFSDEKPDYVIDCTHPFAKEASSNIVRACESAGINYLRVIREQNKCEYTNVVLVENIKKALALISKSYRNKRILFTTGSKDAMLISEFFDLDYVREHMFFRILDGKENVGRILKTGAAEENIITGRGPFSVKDNIDAIKRYNADVLVTKESGKNGGFDEKILACKECGIMAVIIKRPTETGISKTEAFDILSKIKKGEE